MERLKVDIFVPGASMRRSVKNSLKRNAKRDTVNRFSDARQVAAQQVGIAYMPIMVAGTDAEARRDASDKVLIRHIEDALTGQIVEHRLHRFPHMSWELCPTRSQLA